jgi:hypothetical protein
MAWVSMLGLPPPERLTEAAVSPRAVAVADKARPGAEAPPELGESGVGQPRRAAFGPTLALTVILAFAGFGLLMSIVMLVVEPTAITGLDARQRQDAETALYVAAFGVVLPLSLVAAPRAARAIAGGPNAEALSLVAALLSSMLASAILLVRLSDLVAWGGGMGALLVVVGLWWVAAVGILARAGQARPWRGLLRIADRSPVVWGATAVLAVGTLFTVTHLDSLSPLPFVLGLAAIPAIVVLAERWHPPQLRQPWAVGADLLIALLLALAVIDLVFIFPEDPTSSLLDRFRYGVMQFHNDFLLGPANQVLGGSAMLVDTASQYGVGSIYFLVGWFQLAPIGYGTFALLDGVITALVFVAGYCVLRIAASSRWLAASALAVGVIALVLNRVYPVGGLPQEGPLRFGLPMAVILASVAAARWPGRSPAARGAALCALAIASIWSLESFAATLATFAAMACFEAYLMPGGRLRWLARQGVLVGVACVCAHLLFAGATLAGTGQLPEWGQYLAYLRAFLFGNLGNLTYDFTRWSPALAVGASYLASAAAIVLLVRSRTAVVERERTSLLALTGTTAYGIVLFSYFVDRSGDHVLAYVSLPAVLVGALWLGMVLRWPDRVPRGARRGALACSISVAAILVAVAWSSIGAKFDHSALAHVVPGGESARSALDRLWHFPPLDARAPEGERLLERYMPGERRTAVVVRPDLGIEILIRSGRANLLPIAYPWGDDFARAQRVPGLRDAVQELRPGERMLLDRGALATLAAAGRDPTSTLVRGLTPGAPVSPLQVFALQQIDERFRLRPIHRDGAGFVVVELVPRR